MNGGVEEIKDEIKMAELQEIEIKSANFADSSATAVSPTVRKIATGTPLAAAEKPPSRPASPGAAVDRSPKIRTVRAPERGSNGRWKKGEIISDFPTVAESASPSGGDVAAGASVSPANAKRSKWPARAGRPAVETKGEKGGNGGKSPFRNGDSTVETKGENGSTPPPAAESKPKSHAHTPFTAADRTRIKNLVDSGLTAPEIAARIHRGLPQVSRIVRQFAVTAKPTSVPLTLGDSKAKCSMKLLELIAAAAARRHTNPAALALALLEGTFFRGSVSAVLHTAAAPGSAADELRSLQLVFDLEAVGGGRDYRLKTVALAPVRP